MILIEVVKPMFQVDTFEEERFDVDRLVDLDTIGEMQGVAQVHEAVAKIQAARKYNSRIAPPEFN